jgi:hypothetical protein
MCSPAKAAPGQPGLVPQPAREPAGDGRGGGGALRGHRDRGDRPAQRDEIYARLAKLYPGFAEYEAKTTRTIPVMALERAG